MNVEIAQRLAARRKQAGLSQEALAEKLGVSRQAVSKWERSESSPDTDNLIALAQLYGVSLDDLLYVDASIADDVAFEAADRAAENATKTSKHAEVEFIFETTDLPNDVPNQESNRPNQKDEKQPIDDSDTRPNDPAQSTEDSHATTSGVNFEDEGKGKVHIGFDGVHVDDGGDHVHVSWADGVHVVDHHGEEVHVGWDGVRINTKEPIPPEDVFKYARKHHNSGFGKRWVKFPIWAVVIIVYLIGGMLQGLWGLGLFLFFLIPTYYIIIAAIDKKRIAPAIASLYPLASIAWFCWMAFIENQPHPAWAIFLTIPIVEVCVVAFSKWWQHRKQ